MKIAHGVSFKEPSFNKLQSWVARTIKDWRPFKVQKTTHHAHRISIQLWNQLFIKGNKWSNYLYLIWLVHSGKPQISVVVLHTSSSSPHPVCDIVPILQEGMTFSSPPSYLMWYFPPQRSNCPPSWETYRSLQTLSGLIKCSLSDWILLRLQKKMIPDAHAYAQDKERDNAPKEVWTFRNNALKTSEIVVSCD